MLLELCLNMEKQSQTIWLRLRLPDIPLLQLAIALEDLEDIMRKVLTWLFEAQAAYTTLRTSVLPMLEVSKSFFCSRIEKRSFCVSLEVIVFHLVFPVTVVALDLNLEV